MNITFQLTTQSPVSRYGIPALRATMIDGTTKDFGPSDRVPGTSPWETEASASAANVVRTAALGLMPYETDVLGMDIGAARKFCAQWPAGPQIPDEGQPW